MRLIFTLLAAAATCMGAMAATVTIDFSTKGFTNSQVVSEVKQDGITVTFAAGTNTKNSPSYHRTTKSMRLYDGNIMTVASDDELEIEQIAFTFQENAGKVYNFTVNEGEQPVLSSGAYKENADNTALWTGAAPSVTFTKGKAVNGTARVQTLVITTKEATAVSTIEAEKAVTGVRYYNLAGAQSATPFAGANIVVTTYADGSTRAQKVIVAQ